MPPPEANGRSLPKFGEWDVNNPATGEGFTILFNKARDEKKTTSSTTASRPPKNNKSHDSNKQKKPKKLLCCFYGA